MNVLEKLYGQLYRHYGPQYWWPAKAGSSRQFEICIGAILTQNTSWKNVEKAIEKLHTNKLMTVDAILGCSTKKLSGIIRSCGYHNQKAERLKIFCRHLKEKYDSSLSRMLSKPTAELREELLSIKGIGPETADSIMLYAAEKPIFVIDAYTKRILSRYGLINIGANYEEVQQFFHERLKPNEALYNEYHALLVAHGKSICMKKPLCSKCPLVRECKKIGVG